MKKIKHFKVRITENTEKFLKKASVEKGMYMQDFLGMILTLAKNNYKKWDINKK